MRPAYPNPYLMAHGEAVTNGAGGFFGAVSLYNDATAPVVLAVWQWYEPTLNASSFGGFFITSSKVGASPVQGLPIVSNNPAIPGQVMFGNVNAIPTSGTYSWALPAVNTGVWYPFAVLTGGYSITAYASAVATVLAVGFLWEAVHPDEFRARYHLGDHYNIVPGTP